MERWIKILVVEDEYISRILLTEMLSAYGTCHVATDGKEAVAIIERSLDSTEQFDLVCLDIMMPEMDGHEVLQLIRKMEEARNIRGITKVIMTTTLNDTKNIARAFTQGGCEAYLIKPIDRMNLVQHLLALKVLSQAGIVS